MKELETRSEVFFINPTVEIFLLLLVMTFLKPI